MHVLLKILAILLISVSAFAADVCVGPSSSGDGNGGDWSNIAQWSTLSFTRGNTYYLQDGTYGSKTLNTAASGSTYIYIKKSTESAHGSATGWNSAYGDGTADFSSGAALTITTDYWDIDGVTGGCGSGGTCSNTADWKTGHGIHFDAAAGAAVNQIDITDRTGIYIRHIYFSQTGDVTQYGDGDSSTGIFASTGAGNHTLTSSTIEYCYFNNLGGLSIYLPADGSNNIIQHNYFGYVGGMSIFDGDDHSEQIVQRGMDYLHIRWNFFRLGPSSGAFVCNTGGTDSNYVYIYGNVFLDGKPIVANGTNSNWRVFNNTIVSSGNRTDAPTGFDTYDPQTYGPMATGNSNTLFYNNLMYAVDGGNQSFVQYTSDYHGYNWFSNLSTDTNQLTHDDIINNENICKNCESGADGIYSETSNPFANAGGINPADYALSGPLVNKQPSSTTSYPGYNVCLLETCEGEIKYNIDMFGNTRGSDGTWEIGAIEYYGGPSQGGPSSITGGGAGSIPGGGSSSILGNP